MLKMRASLRSSIAALLIASTALGALAPAVAQDRDRRDIRDDRRDDRDGGRGGARLEWRSDRHWHGSPRVVVVQRQPPAYRRIAVPRSRSYNHIQVLRPYGRPYLGFGFHYRDRDALRFLGLTALGLFVFNELNETQQRAHEEALTQATSAPIGDAIIWNEAGRSGTVTAVRDGVTADGRQCREFQQEVVIGGRNTEAYSTACQQTDGNWQVVDD